MTFEAAVRGGVLFLALMACAPERPGAAAAKLEQALSAPAALLELSGAGAGSLASVTPVGSASVCGATTLKLELGVNMSSTVALWLNDTLSGKPSQRSGALYLASSAQKVAFQGKVTAITFPLLDLSSSAPVFFVVTLATSATKCTAVDPATAAQAQQLALAWAALQPLASEFELTIASNVVGKSGTCKVGATSDLDSKYTDIKITVGLADAGPLSDWITSILRDKRVVEDEFSMSISTGNRELLKMASNGPASATIGQTVGLQLSNVTLTPTAPPDAGP